MTIDGQGRLCVVASGSCLVFRIDDLTGGGFQKYGKLGRGRDAFWSPLGIAVDGRGSIYVCDTGNRRIVKIDDLTGSGWTELRLSGAGRSAPALPTTSLWTPAAGCTSPITPMAGS